MGQVEVAYSEDLGPAEEHCAPEPTALVIISGEQDCSLSWRETLSHPTNLGPKQPGPCMLCTPSQSSPSAQVHGRWPLPPAEKSRQRGRLELCRT